MNNFISSAVTIDFLSKNSIQLVTHQAYSPGMASYDFFLLLTVKGEVRPDKSGCCDNAICAFTEAISDLIKENGPIVLRCGFCCARLCTKAKGEYLEQL